MKDLLLDYGEWMKWWVVHPTVVENPSPGRFCHISSLLHSLARNVSCQNSPHSLHATVEQTLSHFIPKQAFLLVYLAAWLEIFLCPYTGQSNNNRHSF